MENESIDRINKCRKYEKIERPTGLWLSELTHFYDVLVKNGIDADLSVLKADMYL